MEPRCLQFNKLSEKSLKDPNLQQALTWVYSRLAVPRNKAFERLENADALRDRAHGIKKRTLERLDEYLASLEENVIRLGGKVHWASTASRAREIISDIARDRAVRSVVKGKSMVTEEIGLNESLMHQGIEVSETDLGEFIIQLAGEAPSHLVGPAIHKTKEQVSRLFSRRLGAENLGDPRDMAMLARRNLRRKFFEADMGITGVNFAVAETGTVVLFENEGNIRLTTTLPRIHIAVMGIEKVVPTLDDLGVLMGLLARSTTGQKISAYVSMINGPKGPEDMDGAEEFHLVIIDNGRSGILSDPELRETLYCIRCGACLNCCPVFLKIGGHAYGWVYSGPIGSILTPQLISRREASKLPYASTLCGACADVCPVKIDHPRLLLELRRRYSEDPGWKDATPFYERLLLGTYARIMRNKEIYTGLSGMGRLVRKGLEMTGFSKILSRKGILPDRLEGIQPFSEESFRKKWKRFSGEDAHE